MRCLTRTCHGIDLAGVTGLRSRGWGAGYALGVGCRLYHAGSPRGPAYESHPWRKGWPLVSYDGVGYKNGCIQETVVPPVGTAFEGDTILHMFVAILGHACTVLRFSVGYADRATVPPQRFEEHGGEKNRRRIPTIHHLQPRSHMYVPADTRRPCPDIPLATTIHARTPPVTHVPPYLFPGFPLTHGHPHGRLPPPRPLLAPGHPWSPPNLGAGGWRFGV